MRMLLLSALLVAAPFIAAPSVAAPASTAATFSSAGHTIRYDVFASGKADDPVLILLPGTSGPEAPYYRSEASFFAGHGYTTLLLHYFDAARSRTPSDETYTAWAKALEDLIQTAGTDPGMKGRPVYVVGYSLGASVALAAGSEKLPVKAMAEWYGSLPDTFFAKLGGMPPLLILHGAKDGNIPVVNGEQLIRLCGIRKFDCASHIYPEESHGFSDAAKADAHGRTLRFFAEHGGAAPTEPVPAEPTPAQPSR